MVGIFGADLRTDSGSFAPPFGASWGTRRSFPGVLLGRHSVAWMAVALARALAGVISRVMSGVSPVSSGINLVVGGLSGPKLGRFAPKLGSTKSPYNRTYTTYNRTFTTFSPIYNSS